MNIKFIILTNVLLFNCQHIAAQQTTSLDEIYLVTDTSLSMPASNGMVNMSDDDVGIFNVGSEFTSLSSPLGAIDQAGIDGYHNTDECGEAIFSLDNSAFINGQAVTSSDVFFADGTILLDAEELGFPKGVNINGLSRVPGTCELIFSIDVTAKINTTVYLPNDLISWNGLDELDLYQSIEISGNIDAIHILNSNRALLSFDTSTLEGDQFYHDESIIEIEYNELDHLLAFEPLVFDESWIAADLSALSVKTTTDDLIFINGYEASGFPKAKK